MKTKTLRKIVVVLLVIAAVAVAGHFAVRGYVSHRQGRLIRQARGYLEKDDTKRAALCVQRVLRSNPRNVEACRLRAELAERSRSPREAFFWRSHVVDLNPRSADDRLALAQAALSLRDYASATNALEGVDAAGKKTAAYHNVAGAVAAAAGQTAAAEAHFLEVIRLEPQNAFPQLNLAVVRIISTNEATLTEARGMLRRISVNPTNSALRCRALRELAADALRHNQADSALALSRQLLLETNSVFADRFLRLSVLQRTHSAEFDSVLAEFRREATQGTNALNQIRELATWQVANSGPKDALAWLGSLPRTTRTNEPVAFLIAECQIALQDWRSLLATLDGQNWAELEFVRHAFKARGLRGQGLADAAKTEWELAMKGANAQRTSLVMLLRLAGQWNWQNEGEDLLWTIVNRYPSDKSAAQALGQVLYDAGRTRSLLTFFSQQTKIAPSDLSVKNNLAMTALLLDANELKPHDLAREVYQKAPTNASYASTYAFSLHLQKKDAEALKVMQQLKPKDLETPSIAGYYGLLLQATGDREKAKVYLQWAAKASLLPEEKKLFEQAKSGA